MKTKVKQFIPLLLLAVLLVTGYTYAVTAEISAEVESVQALSERVQQQEFSLPDVEVLKKVLDFLSGIL